MRLPSTTIELPNRLICPAAEVPPSSSQYHLLKHPLGVNREGGPRSAQSWDVEGWTTIQPPVVQPGEREQAFTEIGRQDIGGARCLVPEVRGRRGTSRDNRACDQCHHAVRDACVRILQTVVPIAPRYAAAAESVLVGLGDGLLVGRSAVFEAVWSLARWPDKLGTFSVLSVGMVGDERDHHVARAARGDGVCVDFTLSGHTMRWRTTWRRPEVDLGHVKFLARLTQEVGSPLSATCLVARPWWEEHGRR